MAPHGGAFQLDERGKSLQLGASFALALALGLGLGILNWAFWSKTAKRLFEKKSWKKNSFISLSVIKLTVLSLTIWLLLSLGLEPIGFLIGFSVVIVWMFFRGARWA